MAKEIERKFLVISNGWRENAVGTHYRQGYLNSVKERTVRIRTINDKAFLTVKGLTVGCTRLEFEYSIPYDDCVKMLDELAEKPIIEKTRYKIPPKIHPSRNLTGLAKRSLQILVISIPTSSLILTPHGISR